MPKLEIGCGSNPQPGYVHTDAYVDDSNRHLVDHICDARSLPFPDKSFEEVLMFGVFEHFGFFEAREVLLEVSRVLMVPGLLKFDVPDFDWFVDAYRTGRDGNTGEKLAVGRDEHWIMKSIFGGQDGPGQFHKWGWNRDRLEKLLKKKEFNFYEIRLVGRQWRDPESNHLIYECIK